jgi:hypothetical protein
VNVVHKAGTRRALGAGLDFLYLLASFTNLRRASLPEFLLEKGFLCLEIALPENSNSE